MAKQGNIRFGIGFDVDKSGLEQLKSSLANLSHINKFDLVDSNASIKELEEIKQVAGQVGTALQSSFNKDLGTYNIQTFKKALTDAGLSTQTISKTFAQAGEKGKIAFRNMANAVSSTKLELRESHSLLDKMGATLTNTIRWSIASSAINAVTGSIQKAWSFTKQLDSSLNDIMIVTGKSSEEMDRFATKANNAAKALGSNTKAYADAALIYYQQGLGDEEAQARASVTVKAANVTGQSAQAVSEQLTAVWNGYKVSAAESEKYIDKLAAVAATTAADLEELSVGMSRVASAANIMGVDVDQLNAQLATIVSVTREAPESIGTALKTVYARMSDIEAGLDTETTLGEYTSQMAQMGINVLDAQGKLRDMGDVVEEIGGKWNSLNREQQVSLAQSIAGTRQYSRMMSLFDNWDMYQEALTTSQTSMGTLQKQQDIYMESLEAHLNQLTAKSETLYSKLFDSDSFKTFIDIAGGALETISHLVESLGGGGSVLLALIPTLTNLFSKNIASGLATTITNFQNARENAELLRNTLASIQPFKLEGIEEVTRKIATLKENIVVLRQQGLLTNEQFNQFGTTLEESIKFANQASEIRANREKIDKRMGSGAAITEAPTLNDIAASAAKGDKEGAQASLAQFNTEVESRALTVTGLTDAGLAKPEENATYEQKIQAAKEYLELLRQTAEESGLASEEHLAYLDKEIQSINAASEAEKKKREERLAAIDTELAEAKEDEVAAWNEGDQSGLDQAGARIEKLKLERQQILQINAAYGDQEAVIEKVSNRAKKASERTTEAVKKGAQEAKDAGAKAASGLESELDAKSKNAANKVVKNLKKVNLTSVIQQVTKVTSAIGQMASAINIISNLGSIWSNEDLSVGQKTLQTIMNLTTAIGMMTPAIGLAKTMWDAFTLSKQKNAAISALVAAGETKEGAAKALNAIASLSGAAATELLEKSKDKLNAETYEAIAANIAEGGSIGAAAAAKIAAVAPTAALAAAKGVETGAVTTNTAAWYANPIMWIALIVVGAIAAIVGLVAGIIALTKALDEEAKAAEKLENATKHAEEMGQAFANAKKEYEDLKASIEDYKNAQKAIDELVTGTKEWSDAIAASNTQVMELIKKYPELAQYMTNEGGRLILSEEGMEKVLEEEQQEVQEAERMSLMAQQRQSSAKQDLARTRAQDDISGASVGEGALNGAVVGMASMGVIGGLYGAMVGAAVAAEGEVSEDETQQIADYLAKSPDAFSSKDQFTEALKGSGFEHMADALWENKDALEDLTNATAAAEAEQAALRQQLALSRLQETEVYKELTEAYADIKKEKESLDRADYSSAKDYYADVAKKQKAMQEKQDDIDLLNAMNSSKQAENLIRQTAVDDLSSELGGANVFDPTSWSDEQKEKYVKEYYAKLYDISESDIALGSDEDGSNFSITYLDKDGKQQKIEEDLLTWEDFGKNLVDQRMASISLTDEEVNKQLDKFKKGLSEADQKAFKSFVGDAEGDFSKLTEKEFKAIEETWDGVKWEDIVDENGNVINQELKNELVKKAEALGLETTDEALQELLKGITSAVDNYQAEDEKIKSLLETSSLVLDEDTQEIFNSFDQATKKAWAQRIKEAALISDAAGQQITDFFNAVTAENMAMVNTAMSEVNWADANSVERFSEAMLELDEFKGDPEKVADFVFQMKYAQGAIESFDAGKMADSFNSLEDILKSVASDGRSIDADQYKTLSSEMQKYFLRMADGTYALIGAADEFRAAAKAARKEQNQKRLDELARAEEQRHTSETTVSAARKNDIQAQNEQEAANITKRINTVAGGSDLSLSSMGYDDSKDKNASDVVPASAMNVSEGEAALSLIEDYYPNSGLNIDSLRGKIKAGTLTYGELEKIAPIYNTAKANAKQRAADLTSGKVAEQTIAKEQAELDKKNGGLKISEDMQGQISTMFAEAGSAAEVEKLRKDFVSKYGHMKGAEDYINTEASQYSNKFTEDAKNFKIDIDPYEQINKSIEKSNKELEKFSELQEMAYGQDAINNITKYNQELRNQIGLLDQKLNKQEAELETSKTDLLNTDFMKDDGTKVSFKDMVGGEAAFEYDADGNITNWDSLVGIATQWVKNNYSAEEAEAFAARLAENKDGYDTLLSEYLATQEERRAKNMEILEKNLEAFELKLELKINDTEMKRAFSDFQQAFLEEDDFLGIGSSLANSFQLAKDDVSAYTNALKDLSTYEIISEETFNQLSEQGTLTDKQLTAAMKEEKERELLNSLMEAGLSLQDAQNTIVENIANYYDHITETYDNYVDLVEKVNSALDHQRTLTELIYGKKAYDQMSEYYDAQVQNLGSIANIRLDQYNTLASQLAKATTDEEKAALQEAYLNSAEGYFSALNDLAAVRQEQYLNDLQVRFDAAKKSLGITDEDKKAYAWEVSKSQDFLNPLDVAFGIQSVERAFDKSINMNTSISAQAKLNALREQELKQLNEKDKLTKYDLDRAQKRLAVAQAEIALQEAQANKSKMRLVRGANGTYSYQYEADMDAVTKAEETLAKANQELTNLDQTELQNQLDKAYKLWEEYQQKIAELDPNDQEKIKEITDQYSARIGELSENAQHVFGRLNESVASAADLLGEDITVNMVASWADTEFAKGIFNFDSFDWDTFSTQLGTIAGEASADLMDIQTELTTVLTNYKTILGDDESGLIGSAKALIPAQNEVSSTLDTLRESAAEAARQLDKIKGVVLTMVDSNKDGIPDAIATESYDTGGYTGAWGSDGKLATLHEKELVLNKQDTVNILSAIEIMREIENGLSANLLAKVLESMAQISTQNLSFKTNDGKDAIEQTVHITAEFPNVDSKAEIEAAFDELITLAQQKAYEN